MTFMTSEAAFTFFIFAFLRLSYLLGMTAAAGGKPRFVRKIFVCCSMTGNTLDIHQSVFAVKPDLFLISVTFGAVLFDRHDRMQLCGRCDLRLEQQAASG